MKKDFNFPRSIHPNLNCPLYKWEHNLFSLSFSGLPCIIRLLEMTELCMKVSIDNGLEKNVQMNRKLGIKKTLNHWLTAWVSGDNLNTTLSPTALCVQSTLTGVSDTIRSADRGERIRGICFATSNRRAHASSSAIFWGFTRRSKGTQCIKAWIYNVIDINRTEKCKELFTKFSSSYFSY